MNITDKIRIAVCDGNTGLVLTAKAIILLVMAKYPDTNPASITVSDRAQSGNQAKPYADYLFERVAGGYKVLAPEARTVQGKRSKAGSADMTLQQAQAIVAAHHATPEALATVGTSMNGNGSLSDADLEALTAPEAQ